jgi:hypothetical protein
MGSRSLSLPLLLRVQKRTAPASISALFVAIGTF